MHNSSTGARPLKPLGAPDNSQHAWAATPTACPSGALGGCAAVALFNAADAAKQVVLRLQPLGLMPESKPGNATFDPAAVRLCGRNLWSRRRLVGSTVLDVFAPKARACVAFCAAMCFFVALTSVTCASQLPQHGAALYTLWCAEKCGAGDDMFAARSQL